MSERAVARLIAAGVLVVVHRSVYRAAGAPDTWEFRLWAALLAAPPGAVLSHGTAAALHDLRRAADRRVVHLLVPRLGQLDLDDTVVVHRTRRLDPCDVSVIDGLAVTTGPRTVLDLCSQATPGEAVAIVDDALGARLATRRRLHLRALELSAGRRHASLVARLTAPGAEGEIHSYLERMASGVFGLAGLPRPEWNVAVEDRRGRFIALVDARWEKQRVILQLDSVGFHSTSAERARDRRQDNALGARYRVLRYEYRELLDEGDRIAGEVAEALGLG